MKFILILLAAGFGFIFSQRFFIERVSFTNIQDLGAGIEIPQEMTGVRLVESNGNQLGWILTAKKAESWKNDQWKLSDARVKFFGGKSVPQYEIESKIGLISYTETNVELELLGGVVAKALNGYTIFTEKVKYLESMSQISSKTPIRVTGGKNNLEVTSKSFVGNIKTGVLELEEDVRSLQDVLNYEDVEIKSDKAIINSRLRDVRFSKNLRISQDKFLVTGNEAFFAFDSNKKQLKSIQILGDVRGREGERVATADQVEMRLQEDVILLQGNPRVSANGNDLVGKEIILSNGRKDIQIVKGWIQSDKEQFKGND